MGQKTELFSSKEKTILENFPQLKLSKIRVGKKERRGGKCDLNLTSGVYPKVIPPAGKSNPQKWNTDRPLTQLYFIWGSNHLLH